MAHILKARVAESSTSTSTGDMTLAGALTGHVTYASVCSIGDTTEYVIYGADAYGFPTGEWEEGIGTYSALNKLTRTTPKGGSTTTPVDFSAGTKIVIMTPLGSRVGAIPRGGSANQVLSKATGNDLDLAWVDPSASITIDATPTDGSSNAVSSNGVFDALAGKADTGHNQAASTISDSTTVGRAVLTATDAAAARSAIGAGTSSFDGAYSSLSGKPTLGDAATKNTGTTTGTVAAGDDARLSDARTPTAHTHALSDMTQSGAATGQVPTWNGSAWAPATPSASGVSQPDLNITRSIQFGAF